MNQEIVTGIALTKGIIEFSILKFIAAFLCFELALVLLFLYCQKVGKRRDLFFAFMSFCLSGYFIASSMVNLSTQDLAIIFWTKISIASIIPLMTIYPIFIYEVVGVRSEKWVYHTVWLTLAFIAITPTKLLINGLSQNNYILDLPGIAQRQPLYHLFILCFAASLGVSTARAFSRWKHALDEPLSLVVKSRLFKAGIVFALLCGLNDVLGIWEVYRTVSISAVGFSVLCIIIIYRILFVQGKLYQSLKQRYRETIATLAKMLDAKDGYTAGHSERVSLYADAIAEGMEFSEVEQEIIQRAALLHDIGKIAVPDSILRNPYPLSEEEWSVMKSHAQRGREILSSVEFLLPEIQMAFVHHERYDGKGYPNGLKGDEIPLGAQIIALADAFDAMTSNRAYRQALPLDKVVAEIDRYSGTQFAPNVVQAFKKQLDYIIALREKAFASQSEKHRDQKPITQE